MTLDSLQTRAEQLLRQAGILPVITVDSVDQGRRIAEALLEGGLTSLELTLRTPVALDAIKAIATEVPEILVGAGTIVSPDQARQAADAGASFLVSPGATPSLLAAMRVRRSPKRKSC